MNTKYNLEVLDEVRDELMDLYHENSLMKKKFGYYVDYYGYGVCCTMEKRLDRISNLLQDIEGAIEEEQLRLSKIKSQM